LSTVALFTWMATVLAGLLLFVIWLMEYDRDFQSVAATRLPVTVISSHALLGIIGLMAWGFYLATDEDKLALGSVVDLGIVAVLGLIMAARWLQVYRAYSTRGASQAAVVALPPERHFPRSVIIIHGILAFATIVLVVIAVWFSGS
jgi:manganese efflux pump family protein